jgi:transglutaminase-like putative cysteine protease
MINNISRLFATAAFACLAITPTVHAQDKVEYPVIEKLWHATYDVEKDGRVTETVETRFQVLQQNMLERMKVYTISYSTSIQTGEMLEAYTLKKDGRQIAVPAGNYQVRTSDGRGKAGPMFSDQTSVSVVFPDMEVGDTMHVKYRIAAKEAMFPGQFSLALGFSPFGYYEDTRITVRMPKDMPAKSEAHFFQAAKPQAQGDKSVLEWRYRNVQPRRPTEEDEGVWKQDEVPSVLVSTFPTHEAIAKAYGDRALPKAQPTPRIREIVRTALAGEARPREQARLLYEWVSRNITYGGNCIGLGAVVPRDLDVVLDNKMGDCKDHATLLQAMLTSAGIRSEQVLINAGSQYDLPTTPVVSQVNHVMNFLPDFNQYVDATAKEIPFGYLPGGSYFKPVIHVGAAKALATIPAEKPGDSQQRLQMTLKVADNGSATGSMRVAVKGLAAAYLRAEHRDLSAEEEREFVKGALSRYGYRGKGTLEKGDTRGMGDSYEFAIKFDIDNFLRGGSNGAFVFYPVAASPIPVSTFADAEDRIDSKRRQRCTGFSTSETYQIELPASMKLVAMPDNAKVRSRLLDFTATYEKTATGVRVTREVNDKTFQGICSPEVMTEFNKAVRPVGENLRTQVLYRRNPA